MYVQNVFSVAVIYLITVLAMGASTVIFSIFLLDLHHRDGKESVPLWVQRLFRYLVAKIACYPDCYGCAKSKPAQVEPRKYSTNQKNGLPPDMTSVNQPDIYTWQDIVKMLDRLYLRIYLTVISILTLVIVAVMANN